jgi:hypothetical protein
VRDNGPRWPLLEGQRRLDGVLLGEIPAVAARAAVNPAFGSVGDAVARYERSHEEAQQETPDDHPVVRLVLPRSYEIVASMEIAYTKNTVVPMRNPARAAFWALGHA